MKKYCDNCNHQLFLKEFSINNYKSDGLQSTCKECCKKRHKLWYRKNYKSHRVRANKNARRYRLRNSKRILKYLLKHPCVDCGEDDPIVLEFDHVRGKKLKEVSILSYSAWSWQHVKDEIAKCDVRCANCHRRKTFKKCQRATLLKGIVT